MEVIHNQAKDIAKAMGMKIEIWNKRNREDNSIGFLICQMWEPTFTEITTDKMTLRGIHPKASSWMIMGGYKGLKLKPTNTWPISSSNAKSITWTSRRHPRITTWSRRGVVGWIMPTIGSIRHTTIVNHLKVIRLTQVSMCKESVVWGIILRTNSRSPMKATDKGPGNWKRNDDRGTKKDSSDRDLMSSSAKSKDNSPFW